MQSIIGNVAFVNDCSLHDTYFRTVMQRFVYVTLYVYITFLISISLLARDSSFDGLCKVSLFPLLLQDMLNE